MSDDKLSTETYCQPTCEPEATGATSGEENGFRVINVFERVYILSTHVNASTLRTSNSGSSLSISDDSSGVRHKRPFPEMSTTKAQSATTSKRSKFSAPIQFPRSRQALKLVPVQVRKRASFRETRRPKKTRGTAGPRGPITKAPSFNGQSPVLSKEEQQQARTGGGTIRGRGRGCGEGAPPRYI